MESEDRAASEEQKDPTTPKDTPAAGSRLSSLFGETGSIAAAIVTLGALLTFLGWRTETLPWLENNEPWFILGATLGFCLAVILIAAATLVKGKARLAVSGVALFALACGIGAAVTGGVLGWNHPEFPVFTNPAFQATADGTRITATLKGSRLDSGEAVIFFVDTLRWNAKKHTFDVTHRRADSLSPDSDGKIEQPIATLIPPGDFREVGLVAWAGRKTEFSSAQDCYNQGSRHDEIHCVVLSVERVDERPQLHAKWIEEGRQEFLEVSISAHYTELRPIYVTITGLPGRGHRRLLASFGLEPDATGHFERALQITVPQRFPRVCVVARAGPGPNGCPHHPRRYAHGDTVWYVLNRNVSSTTTQATTR